MRLQVFLNAELGFGDALFYEILFFILFPLSEKKNGEFPQISEIQQRNIWTHSIFSELKLSKYRVLKKEKSFLRLFFFSFFKMELEKKNQNLWTFNLLPETLLLADWSFYNNNKKKKLF